MNDRRERNLRLLLEATGENTKAKAIDMAIRHYLRDLKNKREVAESLTRGELEALSTPQMPIERPETTVGPDTDG